MDIERRREEAELGADRKPRLIEESELPDFLNQARIYETLRRKGELHNVRPLSSKIWTIKCTF